MTPTKMSPGDRLTAWIAHRAGEVGGRLRALRNVGASDPSATPRGTSGSVQKEKIRVAIFINTLAPYGAETFVYNHACHADRERFHITVCYFGGSDALVEKLREIGVDVVCFGGRRNPTAVLRAYDFLRKQRIDVLQTHLSFAGAIGRVFGTTLNVPAIVSTEQNMRDKVPAAWMRVTDLTFCLADKNVFISHAVARSFAHEFPDLFTHNPCVIPDGIDTWAIGKAARGARAEVRAELGLRDNDFAFVQVARLNFIKGHCFSIKAFARLRARVPQASLWLIGDGELRSELGLLAESEGVADSVHFVGQRMDVHRLLGGFDALVHTSLSEALGIAVLEGMAAGLPALASRVDGVPEIVTHGKTGWLHDLGDVITLSDQMAECATDPEKTAAIADAGRLSVSAYDIRQSVAEYEALYTQLVGSRDAPRSDG